MQIDIEQRSTAAPQFRSDTLQQSLAHWNRERLSPQFPADDWPQHFEHEAQMRYLETSFLGTYPIAAALQRGSIRAS